MPVTGVPSIDVTVIIPAYREAEAVGRVVAAAQRALDGSRWSYELLVIDDGSDDRTGEQALAAGARVIKRPRNMGKGAAEKLGLRLARGRYAAIIDADLQHDPAELPRLLEPLPRYDMVVAARDASSPQSLHRRIANACYNRFAAYIVNFPIADLTSGFRVMKTELAQRYLYLLPNGFSSPTTLTLAMIRAGFIVHYVPVRMSARVGRSKILPLRDGLRFILIMLRIGTLFAPFRVFLPASLLLMLLGLGYGIDRLWELGRVTSGVLFFAAAAIFCFMLSLVAQQVAALHFLQSDGPLSQTHVDILEPDGAGAEDQPQPPAG